MIVSAPKEEADKEIKKSGHTKSMAKRKKKES